MLLSDFDFDLPKELIANHPVHPRENAKLMQVIGNEITHHHIYDLLTILSENDVLVFNNTKVIKAKFLAYNNEDRAFEFCLAKCLAQDTWDALVKKPKKLNLGEELKIADDFSCTIEAKKEGGFVTLKFNSNDVAAKLDKYGFMPLPLYIDRKTEKPLSDNVDYQTSFAEKEGSVAAPTAGLHFSKEFLEKIKNKNIEIHYVTLHVGLGTFMPVKVDNIKEHIMHEEYCEVTQATANAINKAKKAGKNIVAVGTTALRTLESCSDENGNLKEFYGETGIFITPGYKFKIIDKLITNFHIPKSTLFMLVSALCGLDNMKKAYAEAIEKKYRFFSYGDCCLLYKK